MVPLVTCILPTCDRPGFFQQALKYFRHQTYPNKELVIMDDGAAPVAALVPDSSTMQYFSLDHHTSLGSKLNLAISQAHGQIIQKLDDDDYYPPRFLENTVQALTRGGSRHAIAGMDSFLVFIARTGELKHSGSGWFCGASFCFYKELWEKIPFRDLPRAVDWQFLQDTQAPRLRIHQAELLMVVRHTQGHTWIKLGQQDVTDYFSKRTNYPKSLSAYLNSPEYLAFYEALRIEEGALRPPQKARRTS